MDEDGDMVLLGVVVVVVVVRSEKAIVGGRGGDDGIIIVDEGWLGIFFLPVAHEQIDREARDPGVEHANGPHHAQHVFIVGRVRDAAVTERGGGARNSHAATEGVGRLVVIFCWRG